MSVELLVFLQREELRPELIADLNNPAHLYNMTCRPYDVNYIVSHWSGLGVYRTLLPSSEHIGNSSATAKEFAGLERTRASVRREC